MKLATIVVLLFLQTVLVITAAWQLLGLLPVLSWLGTSANVTAGMWLAAGIKSVILLLAALLWYVFGRLRRRVRGPSQASVPRA